MDVLKKCLIGYYFKLCNTNKCIRLQCIVRQWKTVDRTQHKDDNNIIVKSIYKYYYFTKW